MLAPPNSADSSQFLMDCWYAGIDSVKGQVATDRALQNKAIPKIDRVLAVGKAASSMCMGLLPHVDAHTQFLLVTKYGHVDDVIKEECQFRGGNFEILESAHPVPDCNSLLAGTRALEFVKSAGPNEAMVVLVSGGASSLVEALPTSIDLDDLVFMTEILLNRGYDITQINAIRTRISKVKGGKLLERFSGKSVFVLAISDVPANDVSIIGSGIGCYRHTRSIGGNAGFEVPVEVKEFFSRPGVSTDTQDFLQTFSFSSEIIACNETARNAVSEFAENAGVDIICNEESLHQDVNSAARMIGDCLINGPKGMYIWGGEPTVILPDDPGCGGRNQHLALAVAEVIDGLNNIVIIAAGTDGSDGPTSAAGGVIDGNTFSSFAGARTALMEADSGTWLEKAGALFSSGPTGTNVMDLVIGIKN